jgi:hypothetical protein
MAGPVICSIVVKEEVKRPSTKKILAKTSDEMNKTLPMKIDYLTRLDATFHGPGKVFGYKYTLVGLKAAHLNKARLREAIEPTLIKNYKTHPAMKGLRDLLAVLKYTYFDEAGVLVMEIEVDPTKFETTASDLA